MILAVVILHHPAPWSKQKDAKIAYLSVSKTYPSTKKVILSTGRYGMNTTTALSPPTTQALKGSQYPCPVKKTKTDQWHYCHSGKSSPVYLACNKWKLQIPQQVKVVVLPTQPTSPIWTAAYHNTAAFDMTWAAHHYLKELKNTFNQRWKIDHFFKRYRKKSTDCN